MSDKLRLAFTADLHWGSNRNGDEATRLMRAFLDAQPPDVLVLAGDQGAAGHFDECLALFADLPSFKALVPGNHDIWVERQDARGDSLQVYQMHLPKVCAAHDFHYLDHGPIYFTQANLALAGSINWYDYSWSIDLLEEQYAGYQERLRTKRFTRGQHNDAHFIRWPLDDDRFTRQVVLTLDNHLQEAVARVDHVIVVTHHPPFYDLSFPPKKLPPTLDSLLWDAFAGNIALETMLRRYAEQVPFAFCGHTHRARESRLGPIRGYNIGGDYHFKRLLLLNWPEGTVEAHEFGDPTIQKVR